MYNLCTERLATLLEGVNNRFFEVNFENLILLFLWVFSCVKVGKSDVYGDVKCHAACFYNKKSDKCSVSVRISEKYAVAVKVLREQKG